MRGALKSLLAKKEMEEDEDEGFGRATLFGTSH